MGMKIKEKVKNLRSNIKSSILSAFLSRTFVWIYVGIAVLFAIIMSIIFATRYSSASVSSVAVGNATDGQQCLLSTDTKIDDQKLCAKGLTCFVPLATQAQTQGTCMALPKSVGAGAYCTNSSSGPLCENGTSCQYVKVADSSTSFAKCIQV